MMITLIKMMVVTRSVVDDSDDAVFVEGYCIEYDVIMDNDDG